MNLEIFEQLKTRLRAMPERVGMESFCRRHSSGSCGTVACIAGHVQLMIHGEDSVDPDLSTAAYPQNPSLYPENPKPSLYERQSQLIKENAVAALGITTEEGKRLFFPHYWPDGPKRAFVDARESNQQAEVVCRRLDHFVKTGGRE